MSKQEQHWDKTRNLLMVLHWQFGLYSQLASFLFGAEMNEYHRTISVIHGHIGLHVRDLLEFS